MPDEMTQEEVNALSGTTKLGSCECCDFDDIQVTAYRVPKSGSRPLTSDLEIAWYCDLCSGTMASTWHLYGRIEGEMLSGICYIGNTILKAIKANRLNEVVKQHRAES